MQSGLPWLTFAPAGKRKALCNFLPNLDPNPRNGEAAGAAHCSLAPAPPPGHRWEPRRGCVLATVHAPASLEWRRQTHGASPRLWLHSCPALLLPGGLSHPCGAWRSLQPTPNLLPPTVRPGLLTRFSVMSLPGNKSKGRGVNSPLKPYHTPPHRRQRPHRGDGAESRERTDRTWGK